MDSRDLDTDDVAAVYEDLIDTYEMEWDRHDHRSLHLAYYDEEHDDPASAAVNTIRVLADAADVDGDDTVLNVGCGAGEGSVFLARTRGAFVHGVDVGAAQLEIAREYASEHGVGDLTGFANDDLHALESVGEDAADVYWALEALSHSDDVPGAIEQARRVLRPGGRVAVADLFVRDGDLASESRERLETLQAGLRVRIGTIAELEDALAEQGFTNVEVRDATDGVRESTERRRQFSKYVSPLSGALSAVGFFSDNQVDAMDASSALYDLVDADVLGYFVVTAEL